MHGATKLFHKSSNSAAYFGTGIFTQLLNFIQTVFTSSLFGLNIFLYLVLRHQQPFFDHTQEHINVQTSKKGKAKLISVAPS
jgi:hypothetical protein